MQDREYEKFKDVLRRLAPGTALREGLENVLAAKTGALIVFGDTEDVKKMSDGGFFINEEFLPAKLYELAKMDGAIILSENGKRILYANTHLNPNSSIETSETGIRHRTAERVAKQTELLVISISQRRDLITLYKESGKYILPDVEQLISKANQGIQTIEKYRMAFEDSIVMLNGLELEDLVSLNDVCIAIQQGEMLAKMGREVNRYITELGNEGDIISSHLDQLIGDLDEELKNIVKDYSFTSVNDFDENYFIDLTEISRRLGYYSEVDVLDAPVFTKGYRLLSKIKRIPDYVIDNVIEHFEDFHSILHADMDQLDEVEGVGAVRARNIIEGIRRIRELYSFERK
ncbi:MAG: DNA integrity scanning protein DisA [Clostridiales bacterium]|nr:DNA integrity scanning protein DisA [Clostridiales bacterium]